MAEFVYYDACPGVEVSRVLLDDGDRRISIEAGNFSLFSTEADDSLTVDEVITHMTLTQTAQLVAALSSALSDHLAGGE